MKRLALLLTLALCLPLHAHADDATKRAKVEQLFTVMHMDQMMNQITDGIMKQTTAMTDQMLGDKATPETKQKVADFQAQVFKLVHSEMGWKAMQPVYVELYAQTYTEDEIDGILAFYQSPAGKAMLAKTPELMNKSLEISRSRMTAIQPRLMELLQNFVRQNTPQSDKTAAKAATATPEK